MQGARAREMLQQLGAMEKEAKQLGQVMGSQRSLRAEELRALRAWVVCVCEARCRRHGAATLLHCFCFTAPCFLLRVVT